MRRYLYRVRLISASALLSIRRMMPIDVQQTNFILWGSAYVLLKWTVGVWALRRAKAYFANRRHARAI
jgi:hypothetical protein